MWSRDGGERHWSRPTAPVTFKSSRASWLGESASASPTRVRSPDVVACPGLGPCTLLGRLRVALVGAPILALLSASALPGQEAAGSDPTVIVYLARHAERAEDGTRDPPLSVEGLERVEALRQALRDAPLGHVHSTDLKRTLSTAQPLAEDHGVTVSLYDPFDLEGFAEALKATPGMHFVSGHSNTTPALVRALGGDPHGEIEENEYDRLYIVVITPKAEPVTVLLRYGDRSGG